MVARLGGQRCQGGKRLLAGAAYAPRPALPPLHARTNPSAPVVRPRAGRYLDTPFHTTPDGFEVTLASHYFGHALLTLL